VTGQCKRLSHNISTPKNTMTAAAHDDVIVGTAVDNLRLKHYASSLYIQMTTEARCLPLSDETGFALRATTYTVVDNNRCMQRLATFESTFDSEQHEHEYLCEADGQMTIVSSKQSINPRTLSTTCAQDKRVFKVVQLENGTVCLESTSSANYFLAFDWKSDLKTSLFMKHVDSIESKKTDADIVFIYEPIIHTNRCIQ